MSSKYNLVQKPKKEDEEIEEEIETELESENEKTPSSAAAAKSRMIKFMGIIIIVAVVLILLLFVITIFSKPKYTYSQIESVLRDAAISYFKDYPESLPKDEGSIVEIDSSNLIQAEKMKELSEYTKEEVACSGKVQVEKSRGGYLYTPYLNCGETYTTVELYKKLTAESNIVTSGYGLYSNNGSYVFRGENVDNYVMLDKSMWRVVRITSNNNIVLVSDEGIPYDKTWDDRYNESKMYEAGINQYSVSRIKEFLEKVYKNPSDKEEDGEDILSKKDKTKLVPFNLCVGKRSVNSVGKDNSIECSEVLKNQMLGLLTLSEYMTASLDPNCKTATSKTCKNYNYLSELKEWWLVTADKDENSQVYQIDQGGKVVSELAGTVAGVRPVIYLNNKVLYRSGKGTQKSPYKIK